MLVDTLKLREIPPLKILLLSLNYIRCISNTQFMHQDT